MGRKRGVRDIGMDRRIDGQMDRQIDKIINRLGVI
jgi:hypothetical protein